MAVTRSRDVAELRANLTFDPAKINLQQAQYQCEHGGHRSACVKAEVCFAYRVKSEQQGLNVTTGEPLRAPGDGFGLQSLISVCVLQKSATT